MLILLGVRVLNSRSSDIPTSPPAHLRTYRSGPASTIRLAWVVARLGRSPQLLLLSPASAGGIGTA